MGHLIKNSLETYKFEECITLTSFSTMFVYNFPKNYEGITESHRQLELLFVNKGSLITIEDGKEYVLNAGEAFLHKPYSVHRDMNNNCSSRVSITSFLTSSPDLSFLFDQVIKLSNEQIYALSEIFEYAGRHLTSSRQIWFSDKKKKMIPEAVPYGFKQIIKNKLELFLISLVEGKKDTGGNGVRNYSALSYKIIDILKQNLYEKFNLEQLSDNLSYSKNYLCRHFKANTGYTISSYYYELKIAEAKRLLTETESSVNQIAEALNFGTVQYFSLCFKKNAGVSPSLFRKNVQKERYY
ncbi:MAG: AraC family transcriptional regulator [Bacilli bacterium]|nr:AraC family transcriptional regulator [Bacilli bacterium]